MKLLLICFCFCMITKWLRCDAGWTSSSSGTFISSFIPPSSSRQQQQQQQQQYQSKNTDLSLSFQSFFATTNKEKKNAVSNRDIAVQEILDMARQLGPIGAMKSDIEQEQILQSAMKLKQYTDAKPAKIPLYGIHQLIYSAAKGSSSGKIGPLIGTVSQEFVDDINFINAVEFFGSKNILKFALSKFALSAERKILNDTNIKVTFKKTAIYLFGQKIIEKDITGSGVWKYIFSGIVQDKDGTKKLVRIMQVPSLFIIEQPIN